MDDALRILALLALIGANAFFVIGEYAVVTARRSVLSGRADAGSRGARAALRLMGDPVRVISTVQVGITAVGILTGALGEPLVRDLLGDGVPGWLGFAIAFAVITYLSVVLGELVPKALTLDRAETLAAVVARPIELVSAVLGPPAWLLQRSAAALLRPFGVGEVVAGDGVRSAAELRAVVDEAEEAGVIPQAQEELLHNVLGFATREVGDVMVPAFEVTWLEASSAPEACLDHALAHPHTRYPVARGSLERLEGVVTLHELVIAAREHTAATVADLARPAFVVPETKDLGALLREQRERRQPLALAVDEYGSLIGIVSIEDVVEELVGEIEEDYELPDSTLEWDGEGRVRVAGSMTIDDFNETVGTDLPRGHSRTLAGLVFEQLGRRPQPGDRVETAGVALQVEALDGLRISHLTVRLATAVAAHTADNTNSEKRAAGQRQDP